MNSAFSSPGTGSLGAFSADTGAGHTLPVAQRADMNPVVAVARHCCGRVCAVPQTCPSNGL